MPSLSKLFYSLTKDQEKMIKIGTLRTSNREDHALIVKGSKNSKSKEKKIVKEKKPNTDSEDASLNPTDEGSMKKVKKKGSTSKCYYCSKRFNPKNKNFKNNI